MAKRQVEIPFSISVPNLGYRTLVTSKLMYAYRVVRVKMFFLAAAASLVEHRWYVAGSPTTSTTDWPADTLLHGRESPAAGFVGQSLIRQCEIGVDVHDVGTYIKFSTYNGSGAAYVANGAITLEEL